MVDELMIIFPIVLGQLQGFARAGQSCGTPVQCHGEAPATACSLGFDGMALIGAAGNIH